MGAKSLEIIFIIGVAWFMLMYLSVFAQTKSYGHLITSLGAALTLSSSLFSNSQDIAQLISSLGKILFFGGLAIVGTFGRRLEMERLRASTWNEILRGIVPKHLQSNKLSETNQVILGAFLSLLFGLITYLSGHREAAMIFVIIATVFVLYIVWRKRELP